MIFKFNDKQLEAQRTIFTLATAMWIMLFGGSRSGKTFLIVRNIVMRALLAPKSRHLIARFRFNHVKASIVFDTFPKVMALCFPQVKYHISKSDWFATLPNGSEIWFAGLDDKERTEKILGLEFATVFLNECSQLSWAAVQTVITRLAQLVDMVVDGVNKGPLKLRAYFDCNPPGKGHWTFLLFKRKLNPETKENQANAERYAVFQINPVDNAENLSSEYLQLLDGLSARMQRRFKQGEFSDENPNALFDEAIIDRWRVTDGELPQLIRVVVAVDPSGSGDDDNADNDEIGIAVVALGSDGRGYVLEDCSIKAGPATWARVAVNAYMRHKVDVLVGESNFGGEMVKHTCLTAAREESCRINFKLVHASRGKAVRAEPFSALYEQGKVRHVGLFAKLEDELCAMSNIGYTGVGSPNRADAVIWGLAELFPALVAEPKKTKVKVPREEFYGQGGWMS